MDPEDYEIAPPSSKRRKVEIAVGPGGDSDSLDGLDSLRRPVSPPPVKRKQIETHVLANHHQESLAEAEALADPVKRYSSASLPDSLTHCRDPIASPVQLNRIDGLSASANNDTIELKDILGDPLIKECWQFNYLFDLNFLMQAFDEDVRHLVQVKIVHGSWKRDDLNRQRLEEASKLYQNVQLITAHMPEPFGTHHSKMMCLFRDDNTAEIIIHTANMIRQDWHVLCQAVWRSPRLPLLPATSTRDLDQTSKHIGSGSQFKQDFLAYIAAYNDQNKDRTGGLINYLQRFDFSEIRAALVGSVPSKHGQSSSESHRSWGWPRLKKVLSAVPPSSSNTKSVIVIQVSSIASLGQNREWFENFLRILSACQGQNFMSKMPRVRVVFPTADEIRRSLGGYRSGASIHMKVTTPAQLKQLDYLQPMLCHWACKSPDSAELAARKCNHITREAGRRRAAPHIKTYIRFADENMESIDWAMITSANLSTQAWGSLPNKASDVRVCSWELGVVFWPQLFSNSSESVIMVPTFERDKPTANKRPEHSGKCLIGFRMPYDLPLASYRPDEIPWCATMSHSEPDWKGEIWRV